MQTKVLSNDYGEDTALIVKNNAGYVVGSGEVVFINIKESESNMDKVDENSRFSINNINVSFLFEGNKFDLKRWKTIK